MGNPEKNLKYYAVAKKYFYAESHKSKNIIKTIGYLFIIIMLQCNIFVDKGFCKGV